MSRNDKKQLSREIIELLAKLKASDISMKVGAGDDSVLEDAKSDFEQIQDMQIPDKFTYDFWRYMNLIGDYWAYRYDFEGTKLYKRANIRLAIATARLYGLAGVDKKTGIPYSISVSGGKYIGVPISAMLDDTNYMIPTSDNKTFKPNLDKYKKEIKEFRRDEIALLRCRRTGIGDFVWFMVPLLEWIQADKIGKVNLSMLKNMLFYEIYDKENANNEIKTMLDTYKPIIRVVGSNKFKGDQLGSFNNVRQESFTKETHLEKIISMCKYEFETMLYWMGIPQTSAKNQSLSSDLNLSVSTASIFAKTFDEPVEEFLEELGITNVQIPDIEVQVDNQNADKGGLGKENTEGELNQTKAEREGN